MTEETDNIHTNDVNAKAEEPQTDISESNASAEQPKTTEEEEKHAAEEPKPEPETVEERPSTPPPILTTCGKKRPPYNYDPKKVTLRFIFANRDGLAVTIECRPADTVGEVKGALLSVWPDELPNCSGGDRLRLVCMGKGILMPDGRSLEDCQVPVFKTHPTPINVAIKPENMPLTAEKPRHANSGHSPGNPNTAVTDGNSTSQGCACSIL